MLRCVEGDLQRTWLVARAYRIQVVGVIRLSHCQYLGILHLQNLIRSSRVRPGKMKRCLNVQSPRCLLASHQTHHCHDMDPGATNA